MKILRVSLKNPDKEIINLAVQVLKQGGVIIHATDTCYGLAADIHNEQAVQKLYAIKQMSLEKPTSVMVADKLMLKCYSQLTDRVEFLVRKFWPGALTIVTPKGSQVPIFYNRQHRTIGLRQPDCATSLALVRALGRPLTTTSANISGQPATYSIVEILRQFDQALVKPDLILDAGELEKREASTVVEVIGEELKVIRQGEVRIGS